MVDLYRPWGPLHWILPRLEIDRVSLLGVLGTEDRCTAVLASLSHHVETARFLNILDPQPSPTTAFEARYREIKDIFVTVGAQNDWFHEVKLLENIDTMKEEVAIFLDTAGRNVVLDVTSMPKRWFFPLVRFLLDAPRIDNLLVTYASAERYSEQLSSDPAQLAPLPTFDAPRENERYDELVVGIGFAPLGLKDLYERDVGRIRYLFPFPPGPPHFLRNWQFLRNLESEIENRNIHADDRWHVHMYDIPNIFDALCRFTRDGMRTSALAPFGPKTLSLAMCLFAVAAERAGKEPVHVLYTQPRRYAIDYTVGIRQGLGGVPDIKAYCLRIGGRSLYNL